MLNLFFIMMFIHVISHTQTSDKTLVTPIPIKEQTKKSAERYTYQTHTIGISSRFGGASIFNPSGSSHIGLYTTTFDFYLGKKIGKTQYRSLIQLRLSTSMGAPVSQYKFLNEFRWGILFGGSQYIFDYRNKDSLGWSMMVNGGLLFDLPTIDRLKNSLDNSAVNVGTELDFKAIYNFHKHSAITFGFNIGYTMSYTLRSQIKFDHEGFPTLIPIGMYLENALIWNFSIGMLF